MAGTDATASVPAVALHGICKNFGAVRACDGVDLALHRGRIHGILGENGAGKSTLMKILIGLVLPDQGHIEIHGERRQINDPLAASDLGIGMVHQHFSLVDALSVWENVALGEAGRLDPAAVRNRIGEIGEHYGLEIDPDAQVGQLTAGLRQRVEIIKCLRRDPSIVIFDEPTSVLTTGTSAAAESGLREASQAVTTVAELGPAATAAHTGLSRRHPADRPVPLRSADANASRRQQRQRRPGRVYDVNSATKRLQQHTLDSGRRVAIQRRINSVRPRWSSA